MKLKQEYISKNSSSRLHNLDVPIIGLTGGIATGKSTAASTLADQGILVINADHLVKNIYATEEMVNFVKQKYPDVISEESIDFKKLREMAFSDLEVRTALETEIYAKLPAVFLEEYTRAGKPEIVVYDVPLLFEKGLDSKVDLKVCVYADQKTQLERLTKRDNVSKEQAQLALANQTDIEEKKSNSDAVIENIGTLEQLNSNVADFINQHLEK